MFWAFSTTLSKKFGLQGIGRIINENTLEREGNKFRKVAWLKPNYYRFELLYTDSTQPVKSTSDGR